MSGIIYYGESYLVGIFVQRRIKFGLTLFNRCQPKCSSLSQYCISYYEDMNHTKH